MENNEEKRTLVYNTEKERLVKPEYGRSILEMVKSLKKIEDKEKRSEQAKAVIKAMELMFTNRKTSTINFGTTCSSLPATNSTSTHPIRFQPQSRRLLVLKCLRWRESLYVHRSTDAILKA